MIKKCLQCDSQFSARKERQFCSSLCYHNSTKKERIIKKCVVCSIEISLYPSYSHYKFCSHSCATKWLHMNNRIKPSHWTKSNIGYAGIHKWLQLKFGKANRCENPKCSGKNIKRYDWAKLKGKNYERKRENFWKLCSSCHNRYDYTEKRRKQNSERMKKEIVNRKRGENGRLI